MNVSQREMGRSVAEQELKQKLNEIVDEATRLRDIDGIGIMNEYSRVKSLVGQLDNLVMEFRRCV